jgi:hypothetical protein
VTPYECCGGEVRCCATGDVEVGSGLAPPASTKNSDGEKLSGLLCRDSGDAFERGAEGGFLGTGRIHGGRLCSGEEGSGRGDGSRGIPVTAKIKTNEICDRITEGGCEAYNGKTLP